MDTMYRRKGQKVKDTADTAKTRERNRHAADDYDPKVRPRETHPDFVDSKKRIKRNLSQLNKTMVDHPVAVKEEAASELSEDRGARVRSISIASSVPIPFAFLFSLIVVTAVLMYSISLFVQVQEYSRSIDEMESRIAELKEETTRLEVQLESKYDLGEVERIATQEYGMVVSSTLPKKYISVSEEEDSWMETEKEAPEESFLEQIISGVRKFLGKNEE